VSDSRLLNASRKGNVKQHAAYCELHPICRTQEGSATTQDLRCMHAGGQGSGWSAAAGMCWSAQLLLSRALLCGVVTPGVAWGWQLQLQQGHGP
jgi:hypothetical protein